MSSNRLSKRQVNTYFRDNDCLSDPSLNSHTPYSLLSVFDQTYQCENEKILVVGKNGNGNLYDSVNDWQSELDQLIELGNREPVHILYNQIPSQEHFFQEIPSLISTLAREFGLNISELDKTLESLLILDKSISSRNQQNYIEDNDTKKILGSLIAYIGEVIKLAVNGDWQARQKSRSGWEPLVIAPDGKTFSFCIMVFDELYEAEECSFYDLVSMLIEAHQQ